MNLPDNLKYTKNHEWVRLEGHNAIVGITEFAQGELGDIVFIEVDTEGEHLERDDVFGTIEAVKTVSDLFMPIDGEVIGINGALDASPELINSSPYDDGWIIKVSISSMSQLDELMSADEYKNLVS